MTLPRETIQACREADVVLSGAVGTHPGISAEDCPHPEAALIALRHEFDLRISVRTIRVPGHDDVIIVRNITGGAYACPDQRVESDGVRPAEDRIVLDPGRVREVLGIAAQYARQRPGQRAISVDKASVYATSRLWRRLTRCAEVAGDVTFESVNVDRAAYELARYENLPAVIVTEGLFGDILSDIVCARAARRRCAARPPSTRTGSSAGASPPCSSPPTDRPRTGPGPADPTRPGRGWRSPTCSRGAPTWPSSACTGGSAARWTR